MYRAGHTETVLGLRIGNSVPTSHDSAGLCHRINATLEDALAHRSGQVFREGGNRQREHGRPTHGINVGERIHGCDETVIVGVIDNRREEIDGLHQCHVGADLVDRCVIGFAQSDQQIGVMSKPQTGDDIVQGTRP